MPRLNMLVISITTILSLICYHRVEQVREATYLAEAIEVIHSRGLKDLERQELFNAAMDGMTSKIDRFSTFITREQKTRFTQGLENHFPGIGIRITVNTNKETSEIELVVADTVIGTPTPAHDAGMRSGDRIVAVNGKRLATTEVAKADEIPLPDSTKHITGPAGTSVAVTVVRDGQELTFDVTRKEIDVDTIFGDTRDRDGQWEFTWAADPRIGYIRIESFGERTDAELLMALAKLKASDTIRALILDLRDNLGGVLGASVAMCDLFVDRSKYDGKIVSTRDRDGVDKKVYRATDGETLAGFPIVVLVNGESASASEIFSACLQDHGRAIVCGTRTYGKGLVQGLIPMERGRSILKLTISSFWRPSDVQIHRMDDATDDDDWGIRPDEGFDVPLTDEQEKQRITERRARDAAQVESKEETPAAEPLFDPQLQRAVEHLQTQLEKNSQ